MSCELKDEGQISWDEDMLKIELGTKLLFMNDFEGAESVFLNGMRLTRGEGSNVGRRDMRGAFALQYALVSVIKGVASLANDQLDECLKRLWFAEELSSEDQDWVGKVSLMSFLFVSFYLSNCRML